MRWRPHHNCFTKKYPTEKKRKRSYYENVGFFIHKEKMEKEEEAKK